MGQNSHKLEIFRGLVKFKSNVQKIWGVLIFVRFFLYVKFLKDYSLALGIIKPEILMNTFLSMKLINWIFLILTIIKAYYITWDFMHMRDESFSLQASVVITLIFLMAYLAFILLVEGNYIYDVFFEGFVSWDF